MSKEPKETASTKPLKTYPAWFGFAIRELTTENSVRIRVKWARILAAMVIIGIVMWFGKSWSLYYFFKEIRKFEDVSFTDMILFPLNRGNVRTQQGDYQIDQGKLALEREDYRRAYSLLREGVARSPANTEGRILLAQIYAGWRPDLASDLLIDGIEDGKNDPEFVKLMSMLLLSQKDDARNLEITEELLQEEDLPAEIHQILSVSRLQSAMLTGRYDMVKELYENSDLSKTLDGLILGTRLYSATGQAEMATNVLQSAAGSIPREQAYPVFNELVSVYKKRGMYDRAREIALDMVINDPLEWRPRIILIDVLSASGKTTRRDSEIEALLKEHRNNEQAMVSLAQLSADYGNVKAASRLYEIALENGYSLSLFSLSLAEAHVQNDAFGKAIDLCNELVREDPAWMLNAEGSFNAIRSLAYFGAGDPELGNLYLKNFLDTKRITSTLLLQASKRFSDNDLQEQALAILNEAYVRDARNEQVLATLIDVEMNLGAFFSINEHLQALFELRRPDYELLGSMHERLQSDRFLFTQNRTALLEQLDAIIQEQREMDWEIWETRKSGDS